jgi:EAL domain-containing protein (putative c-di-GMP-specific phosphodiesterase class I)
MQDLTMRRIEIERHLRSAIQRNELEVYYQPQVDSNTFEIVAVEALLRWHHPQWGVVSPVEFIPVAEDCGLIISIGDWVIEQAIGQAKKWHDMGYTQLTIAVNISLAQFNEKILVEKIASKLNKANLEPQFLELELTESIAMQNAEAAIKVTQQLATLGVQLSIDDFGTGYSSLRYLQYFALHKLKIDQSFSKKMVENKETDNIVNAIISMAKSLNLKTITEGVETEQQLNMLKDKGCDQVQGYYFSKPVSADELMKLLESGF